MAWSQRPSAACRPRSVRRVGRDEEEVVQRAEHRLDRCRVVVVAIAVVADPVALERADTSSTTPSAACSRRSAKLRRALWRCRHVPGGAHRPPIPRASRSLAGAHRFAARQTAAQLVGTPCLTGRQRLCEQPRSCAWWTARLLSRAGAPRPPQRIAAPPSSPSGAPRPARRAARDGPHDRIADLPVPAARDAFTRTSARVRHDRPRAAPHLDAAVL